jgi:hypothetical protein
MPLFVLFYQVFNILLYIIPSCEVLRSWILLGISAVSVVWVASSPSSLSSVDWQGIHCTSIFCIVMSVRVMSGSWLLPLRWPDRWELMIFCFSSNRHCLAVLIFVSWLLQISTSWFFSDHLAGIVFNFTWGDSLLLRSGWLFHRF